MPGIAAAQVAPDRRVAAAPEAGEIARHLHRAPRWRQEMQHDGNAALGDAGRLGEAEELLELDRERRRLAGRVIERDLAPAGHAQPRGRFLIEPAPLSRIEPIGEDAREIEAGEVGAAAHPDEIWREPSLERGLQRGIAEIGPGCLAVEAA